MTHIKERYKYVIEFQRIYSISLNAGWGYARVGKGVDPREFIYQRTEDHLKETYFIKGHLYYDT